MACFSCAGIKFTSFWCAGRHSSVLMYGSKLTCFLCAGRKWLVFSVGID